MNNSIFDWVQLFAENVWLYGGAFFLVLGVLVFVHEWGHYIVARMNGVFCESFSIGFGPELFGITDKHGTRWKFSLIPLGGYVKMFGDVDPASAGHSENVDDEETGEIRPLTEEERKVAFFSQPLGARAAIVFAGPAINYIFAIILLAGLFTFYGQPVTPPVASAVMEDSAAFEAGFRPHDEVLAIDGRKIMRFEDIRREVMVGLDEMRTFRVRRGEEIVEINVSPRRVTEEDRFGFEHSRGLLGVISPGNGLAIDRIKAIDGIAMITPDQVRETLLSKMGQLMVVELDRGDQSDKLLIKPYMSQNEELQDSESPGFDRLMISKGEDEIFVKYNPVESLIQATNETFVITVSTLKALGQMVTGTRSATELGGIIRIGAVAGDMAKSGILALISFTALLSINLGLINLFPIPMLDGGHLVFYAVEGIKGSPISEQVQEYAFRFGLAVLIAIMLFANLNDIVQLVL